MGWKNLQNLYKRLKFESNQTIIHVKIPTADPFCIYFDVNNHIAMQAFHNLHSYTSTIVGNIILCQLSNIYLNTLSDVMEWNWEDRREDTLSLKFKKVQYHGVK